jgi:hypothetical protein
VVYSAVVSTLRYGVPVDQMSSDHTLIIIRKEEKSVKQYITLFLVGNWTAMILMVAGGMR